jgi:formylglycine-generating enzyme required for sulfatase activity
MLKEAAFHKPKGLGPAPADDMVWIPGRTFRMGSDEHYPEEAPAHEVTVSGFWIKRCTVTNTEFARFVEATGYVTLAERPANPADYPGADPSKLVPSSVMFRKPKGPVSLRDPYNWWTYVAGADWRHPRGPGSTIRALGNHPVVHVAFEDAEAYAAWAGLALPSEAEWELAARGGLDDAEFCWGNDYMPSGKPMANTWQGDFPWQNLVEDGYEWTSPVGSFPPNGYGLFDMAGNVWEWTADLYRDRHPDEVQSPCCVPRNPRVTDGAESPEREAMPRRVIKGGSHLCAPSYCLRYRPAARQPQEIDTSTSHLGFRCIVRVGGAKH